MHGKTYLVFTAALLVASLNAKGSGAAAEAPERSGHTALLHAVIQGLSDIAYSHHVLVLDPL